MRRDPCAYCGRYYTPKGEAYPRATMDHIYAKTHGGENGWYNYTAACGNCNRKKGDNSLLGYLLGETIPHSVPFSRFGEPLPYEWDQPLSTLGYGLIKDKFPVDERFVGLGARERKVLRRKLALEG